MMPPVDVPTMSSTRSASRTARSASSLAMTAAVKMPRMPPPSRERMRRLVTERLAPKSVGLRRGRRRQRVAGRDDGGGELLLELLEVGRAPLADPQNVLVAGHRVEVRAPAHELDDEQAD